MNTRFTMNPDRESPIKVARVEADCVHPPIPALPFSVPSRHRGSLVPTLLGVVALGVAIGALMRTFWIAR